MYCATIHYNEQRRQRRWLCRVPFGCVSMSVTYNHGKCEFKRTLCLDSVCLRLCFDALPPNTFIVLLYACVSYDNGIFSAILFTTFVVLNIQSNTVLCYDWEDAKQHRVIRYMFMPTNRLEITLKFCIKFKSTLWNGKIKFVIENKTAKNASNIV